MNLVKILSAALFVSLSAQGAYACPQLEGKYSCTENGKDFSDLDVSQIINTNGYTQYTFGDSEPMVADGKVNYDGYGYSFLTCDETTLILAGVASFNDDDGNLVALTTSVRVYKDDSGSLMVDNLFNVVINGVSSQISQKSICSYR